MTKDGVKISPDFRSGTSRQVSGPIPQTDRWPLPGSGQLHPLDYITLAGVQLPLVSMPDGGEELDVSERKEPGSDYSSFVSHGKKNVPVKIQLLLFRDQSQGYRNGQLLGKDWIAEYYKIEPKLIAKSLSRRNAIPVSYPTLHARGCDSLIIVRKSDPKMSVRGQFIVELEGRDPRTIRVGSSHKMKQSKDFGTRANPVPPQQAGTKKGAAATGSPAAAKKGK